MIGSLPYFAYGSNLHRPQMASLAPSAVPLGLARLARWELFVNDHGVLSIRPAGPADEVLGLVWACRPPDLAVLDRFEAVDEGLYRRHTVTVEPLAPTARTPARGPAPMGAAAGGPCHTYRSVSTAAGRPRPGYLEHSVLPPMRALGLPPWYWARVEGWLAAGTAGPAWTPVPAPGAVFSRDQPIPDR